MREINTRLDKDAIKEDEAAQVLAFLNYINELFGIIPQFKPSAIPQKILALAEKREETRKEGKWEEADKMRKEIEEKGYILEDTLSGFRIKKRAQKL